MRRYNLLAVDVGLILCATLFAFALREDLEFVRNNYEAFAPYLIATALVSAVFCAAAGLYRSIWRFCGLHDYVRLAIVVTAICVGSVALSFAYNRLDGVPRSLPFLQDIVGVMALVGARVLHRLSHSSRRKKASTFNAPAKPSEVNVLIVGLTRLTDAYLQALDDFGSARINVAGIVARAERHVGRLVANNPILGAPEDIESILDHLELHGVAIDRIVVTAPFSDFAAPVQDALLRIEAARGISLHFLTEILGLDAGFRKKTDVAPQSHSAVAAARAFEIAPEELQALARRPFWKIKRVVDAVVAFVALVILTPAILAVGVLVAASIGFPVIFWQRRPGRNGQPFHLYKFRTMGAAHSPDGRRLSDEERVSRVGNFLRRTRLDELPQLLNIIWGNMSFIGPRPLLPRDQPRSCAARLLVQPGLTGWAQVVGGRDISPEDKAALDIWYVRNASFFLELETLWRTAPMVLFGERVSVPLIERARRDLAEAGFVNANLAYNIEDSLHTAS
jgi:lipopolysaccharide/colanic/teichoic acid biosynthesis glycosyltransferase